MKSELSDKELILLDQHRDELSDATRALVDSAKARLLYGPELELMGYTGDYNEKAGAFITGVVNQAKNNGVVKYMRCSIRYCSLCGDSAGYAVYARSSRNHRKGDRNLDKPLVMSGVDFADSFVRIQNHTSLGGCQTCITKLKPLLLRDLADMPCELPCELTGKPPQWEKIRYYECSKCDWIGPETLMKREYTLMGGGTYPAGCPKCPAKNGLLQTQLKVSDKFEMRKIEVKPDE